VGDDAAMSGRLPPGKVPWEVIADLVSAEMPAEVKLGPAHGEDAALVEIGGELWAIASDPISFTAHDAGKLAVIVNANDVAVRGARPRFFTAVGLIAPHEATKARIHELLGQVRSTCDSIGVVLLGGHTEVTPGLPHSLIVGTMMGRVENRAITTGGLRDGNLIAMTRSAGLEGTAILVDEYRERLSALHPQGAFDELDKHFGGDWLLVAEHALAAARCKGVSALHDVTEGGVGEALHEMTQASGLTIEADRDRIPILESTRVICADLGLDPLGLIGSGSLLIGCAEAERTRLDEIFDELEVPLTWIARARTVEARPKSNLLRFPRDELLRTEIMTGVEAVVFDMDGTLIDSHYDWPSIRDQLGVDGASIIDDLNGLPEPDRSHRWAELEMIENTASASAKVFEGAHDLLELLADHGLPTALVTNNTDGNTRLLLDRFDLRFDVVLTRDSGFYKPSGQPIREAVRRLDVDAGTCLAVGDSRYDILAARDAGLAGVCIVNDTDGRFAAEADHSFPDIQKFVRFLQIVLPDPRSSA
jgi:HAD superfamily hydrolase (TIGR01549 family)